MFKRIQISDAERLMQLAEDERLAGRRAPTPVAAIAHRQRALTHEISAYQACGSLPDLPVFDEAQFLRFVMQVAVPTAT